MSMQLPQDIRGQLQKQERELLIRGQKLGRFDRIRQREFYSCFLFSPGLGGTIPAGKYELFVTLAGGIGQGYGSPGLTLRETNWQAVRRVADNHNLLIKSFHCAIRRPPSTDQTAQQLTIYPPSVLTGGLVANPPATGKVDLNAPLHPDDVYNIAHGMQLGITYLTNLVPLGMVADFPAPGGAHGFVESSRQFPSNATAGLSSTATGAGNRAQLPLVRNTCPPVWERRADVPTLLQHSETFSMTLIVANQIQLQDVNSAALGANGENNDATGAVELRVSFWATESFVERA